MKSANDIKDFVCAHVRAINRELKETAQNIDPQTANEILQAPQKSMCHQEAMLEAYKSVLEFIEDKKDKRYFY